MTNDTPDDIIFDYFHETAFPNQSLGRSILGPISNIKKFQRQNFLDYINKQYNYDNIAIAAAGNINQDDLIKWCEKYFTNLGNKKLPAIEQGIYHGGKILKEKKLEQVNLVLGFNGLSYYDDRYYAAQILAMILGGGMSSRLFQHVREDLGLAYSIYAFNYNHQDCGLFSIYGATSSDKVLKLLDAKIGRAHV